MSSKFHNQIKKIFLEARELPASQQNEFVKREAKGNHALESEVFSLLENDAEQTILSIDEPEPNHEVIDPLGLEKIKIGTRQSALSEIVFSSKGRVGIAFLIVALILGLFGVLTTQRTKAALAKMRGQETLTILNSNVETLHYWIKNFQTTTELIAADDQIVESIETLLEQPKPSETSNNLDSILSVPLAKTKGFTFIVTDLNGHILYSPISEYNGQRVGDRFGKEIFSVAGGKPQFISPFYPLKKDGQNEYYTEKPMVWMQVPVYNKQGEIIATFGIGRNADTEFTNILRTARMGQSGETYAINKAGWFISESRFEKDMRGNGMMHSDTNISSILNLQARVKNYKTSHDLLPLTALANLVIANADAKGDHESKYLIEPSEDYKGAQVIGAGVWLPEYEFGVITQVDAKEAFAPAKYLYVLIAVVLLLLLSASAYSFYSARQLVDMRGAVNSAIQLGQYELKKLIEEGGMGAVYLAQHRLLKRPTAIKVIRLDKQDQASAKRFEREVHLASQLTHPNTIEIYDYGFTSGDKAYFAMEYLNGRNLAAIVKSSGAMPPGRVVHILRQVCASLFEAHTLGMVHRDIKPQNIMLLNRIGLHDFVKVLDFGLAKPFVETSGIEETRAITGTPVYIAPERLKRPGLAEPSADIYAVGALAYFLLAGNPIFSYSSDLDILYQVLNEMPKPLPETVPQNLARLTFFCLEKSPEERPTSIEELKMFLDNLAIEYPWTSEDAQKAN